jgi:uncharacterized repeat protein (TIGR01451 family)
MIRSLSSIRFVVFGALATACSASPSEQVGKNSAAASTGALLLNVMQPPKSIYLGNPLSIWATINSDGVTVHNDVTVTMVVTGSVTQSNYQVFGKDAGWSCTQTFGKGTITNTCHADSIQQKDGLSFDLMPQVAGTVALDVKATEGGVEVSSFHSDTQIVTASGADMGVYAYGGGQVQAGQTVSVPFTAFNNGPGAATGAMLTLSLVGPGKFVTGPKGPPASCTLTDTSMTCPLGTLAAFASSTIGTLVQTTGPGSLQVSGSVTANEPDPMSYNDTTTVSFDVFQPAVADLAVSMTASADAVVFNKPLTYTIVVTNNGPDAASYPSLYDSFPSDLEFTSVTTTQGGCKGGDTGYLFCSFGALASGASATVTLVVAPTEGGSVSNTVSVLNNASNESDPNTANNSATVTTTVRGPNTPVTVTSNVQKFDVSFFQYAPCTNDYVVLNGTEHYGAHTIYNDRSGVVRYEAHASTEGMTGTGYSSGITYTSKETSHKMATTVNGTVTSSDFDDVYRLVADGPAPDLYVHSIKHVTYAADGTPTAEVVKYSYECR